MALLNQTETGRNYLEWERIRSFRAGGMEAAVGSSGVLTLGEGQGLSGDSAPL